MEHLKVFEVFAIYGENRESPLIFRPVSQFTFAEDRNEAILRSGIHMVLVAARKEPTTEKLDLSYVTIICREVGVAKVKS